MSHRIDGATVLVTGGAGLIGSTIVDQLFDAGAAEVRVLDNLVRGRMANLATARDHPGFVFLKGDIRDQDAVARAVAGCDYVFHQAALRITLCAAKPRDCLDVLAGGTLNVFEAAAESIAPLRFGSRLQHWSVRSVSRAC